MLSEKLILKDFTFLWNIKFHKISRITKFWNLLTSSKFKTCLFMYKVATSFLPKYCSCYLFSVLHSKDKHNYRTRSATQNLLDVPLARTNKYDKKSVNYQFIGDWNNFRKKLPQIPENKLSNMKIKRIRKEAIFDQYWTFYLPQSTSTSAPWIIFTFYLQGLFDWHHTLWFY